MGASTSSGKGILAHTFLKEVGLALKGYQIHSRERVLDKVELGLTEANVSVRVGDFERLPRTHTPFA